MLSLQFKVLYFTIYMGFPGGSDCKESTCSAEEPDLIPGQGDPLEKGMATHSSILTWRIPWTKEPVRLQSMGLQRAGHDLATNAFTSLFNIQFIDDTVIYLTIALWMEAWLFPDFNGSMAFHFINLS